MLNKDILLRHTHPMLPIPTALKPRGKIETQIDCVLFDIYGTLFISGSGDIGVAKQAALKTANLANLLHKFDIQKRPKTILADFFHTIEQEHTKRKGLGIDYPEVRIDHIWMQVLDNPNLETVRAFAAEFELIVNPVYPMPHLKELLAACKNRKLSMGIISNAQFYTADLFNWFLGSELQKLGFASGLIYFSYRFGIAKPSMFLFERALEMVRIRGIAPDSVLYLGNDMLNDIYPAQKAGFKTALFAGDARSLRLREDIPECQNLKADLVITDLIQLLDCFP